MRGFRLTDSTATERLLFPEIFAKPVMLEFDQRQGSSDGGAVLLKAAERRYGLIASMSGCLRDPRQAGKVDHSLRDLFAQRVFSIGCGYADANDSARLAADPMHKMLLDRDPVTGLDMASQPTLSRFENAVGPRQLYNMGAALAESVIERHAHATAASRPAGHHRSGSDRRSHAWGAAVVILQQPLRQRLLSADDGLCHLQRRGRTVSVRRRVASRQCDGGGGSGGDFAPADGLDSQLISQGAHPRSSRRRLCKSRTAGVSGCEPGVEYVVAMAGNAVLNRKAEEAMQVARLLAGLTDQTEHVYGEARYAAGSWKQERRVIIKAEVVRAEDKAPKDNPRFVITNMRQSPQWLYEKVYCQRGEIENRIKELHAMEIDRTSCSRFWANQFRVLLTAAAYVLMQELRLSAAGTNCARAQVWTLRERFLKLGARVVGSAYGAWLCTCRNRSRFWRPSGTWRWNLEHRLGKAASLP
jgi:hypothetical protein